MTLSTEVLPAPLGPIKAVIDPSSTPKLRLSMARTPPNDSVNSSIVSIPHPSLAALARSAGTGSCDGGERPPVQSPPSRPPNPCGQPENKPRQGCQPSGHHEENQHHGGTQDGLGEAAQGGRLLLHDHQDYGPDQRPPGRGQAADNHGGEEEQRQGKVELAVLHDAVVQCEDIPRQAGEESAEA